MLHKHVAPYSATGMARFVQSRRADGVCILNVRRCHPLLCQQLGYRGALF
jgi:hypothetical protein